MNDNVDILAFKKLTIYEAMRYFLDLRKLKACFGLKFPLMISKGVIERGQEELSQGFWIKMDLKGS